MSSHQTCRPRNIDGSIMADWDGELVIGLNPPFGYKGDAAMEFFKRVN